MIWKSVVGHEKKISALKNLISSSDRLPQNLLFSGPPSVGKKLVALGWAQALLCTSEASPCGGCPSCRKVSLKSHPDLHFWETEDSTLKIEDARTVQKFMTLRPFESKRKVVLIDDCEKLTVQAANSLLKTLEEPPAHCHFILVTSRPESLLPTVLSRVQNLKFGGLSLAEISQITKVSDTDLLQMGQGRCDLVTKLADAEFAEIRLKAERVLEQLPTVRTYEAFGWMAELSKEKSHALLSTQVWCSMLQKWGQSKFQESKAPGPAWLGKVSLPDTLCLFQRTLELQQDINNNINRTLAFETYWIKAKELIESSTKR